METLSTIVGWLNDVGVAGLVIAAVWGLVALAARKTRSAYGIFLWLLSYLLGITTWLLCVVVLHDIWGYTGVIIGVLLAGVGVVPLCLFALMSHGQWILLGSILFSLVLIVLCRYGGMSLFEREEKRKKIESLNPDEAIGDHGVMLHGTAGVQQRVTETTPVDVFSEDSSLRAEDRGEQTVEVKMRKRRIAKLDSSTKTRSKPKARPAAQSRREQESE
jgi:hypothetical protein